MLNTKDLLEHLKKINTKKFSIYVGVFLVVGVMAWAFISASLMTANFDHTQVKDSQNEQKVDAIGIIITETKDGKKYFEIYGETGSYTKELNVATLHNVVGNFYKDGNSIRLQPQNALYSPIIVDDCVILGKVIGCIKKF